MIWAFLMGCDMMANEYGAPADPDDHTEIVFEVPKGSRAGSLGPKLANLGVIEDADDFAMYIKLTKEGDCIKAGKHTLKPSMDASTIIETLCQSPKGKDIPLTIIEGWRIREIDAYLTKEKLIKAGEYRDLATQPNLFKADFPLPQNTLEGYLYPETYMINAGRFETKAFIQRQLDELGKVFYTPNAEAIEKSNRTFSDLIIVASMVEREEPKDINMPKVAGVIWKRLDNDWFLGIDATSHYQLKDWNDTKGLNRQIADPNDRYNTRLKKGLPPTPIGSPSKTALEATVKPEETKFWFYLHDEQQNLHMSVNEKQHNQKKRKYRIGKYKRK